VGVVECALLYSFMMPRWAWADVLWLVVVWPKVVYMFLAVAHVGKREYDHNKEGKDVVHIFV
jgi:hypothetical protein